MYTKYKLLVVFGTRPEAIKMAPIVNFLKNNKKINTVTCVTGQHREMLDQVIKVFSLKIHHDLNLMKKNQSLEVITAEILNKLSNLYKKEKPDRILVQGDTTTTFAASLAAFYQRIPVAHVEAGLRTWNPYSPWPEEVNRRLTTSLCDMHFAPTIWAKNNLLRENIVEKNIYVTGNTVIDSLKEAMKMMKKGSGQWKRLAARFNFLNPNKDLILVTGHRRENFGQGFKNICLGLKRISKKLKNVEIIYPVHLNPKVREPVFNILGTNNKLNNVHLIEPLDYLPFIYLMNRSDLILTDSGGVQEEAPTLAKPVFLMRDTTERPEGVIAGTTKLIGTDPENIFNETKYFFSKGKRAFQKLKIRNPYGDGKASSRIVKAILNSIN